MSECEQQLPEWPMPRSCPYAPPDAYEGLRKDPPLKVRIRGGEAWLVTRHADVRQVLNDNRFSADDQKPGFPIRIQLPPEPGVMSFNRMDGSEHGRLRRMAMTEFTARRTRALRPEVELLVERLLDELERGPRPVDLVEHFAVRLPSLVIARMLGVPEEDEATFTEQSRVILSQDATPEETYGAFVEMTGYLDRLAARRTAEPQDDLISRLVTRYVATGELTHQELVAMARFFLVAGHETSAHQISLSVLSLLRDPALLAELRADPGLYKPAVEELLRYWSISQDNQVRAAVADVDLGGARIRAGEGVIVAIPGANHDESVYPDAGRLDIHRNASGHLAFGFGAHLCPGASLARMELEVCLSMLFERFPTLRLALPAEDVRFRQNTLVYGLEELPVTW
ncbi:cytochrome P450 [Streptomyces collinus]|uniref:Cytochrome P450 hydroxylase n=1 Tax=Streptomyces collinus (strain DSM 40733 / Tue 365) TaxID=1214242 RepID=S5VPC3_STRC3|nr:cytochrome P450 [Streptomyces collinus]AGS72407.1 cytochrome P450 hydroxylase [Streptomyces collinus Tu 365]UJA11066.1 cytochrome P450 [Streptomyces collinus]UJA14070.1 cytochrome P450 [Streptomyces collinus]